MKDKQVSLLIIDFNLFNTEAIKIKHRRKYGQIWHVFSNT